MSEYWRDDIMEKEDSEYEKASDAALDARYGYGRASGDKRSFGRAANRASAAAALRAIRRGERSGSGTSREAGSDAVHQGWARTAKTSADQTPEKKERRAVLANTPYSELPDDEKEKDRVSFDAVRAVYNRNKTQKEELDLYDIILSHLLDEGYAETQEQAEVIMVNMSEDWRESICEANRGDEYATRGMSPEDSKTWKSERRNRTRGFSSDVEEKSRNDERYKEKYGKYPRPDPNHMGGSQRRRQADTKDNRGKRTTLTHTTSDTLSSSGIKGTVTEPEIKIGTPLGGTQNPEPKGKYLHRQQMKDAQSSDPTKRSRAPQNSLYHIN